LYVVQHNSGTKKAINYTKGPWRVHRPYHAGVQMIHIYTMCPTDNATAGSLGRRRAGQLRFGFAAVLEGHIVYSIYIYYGQL
jgi:hypothetical protein